jgi:translation elongation factor EF-1alpha
MASFKYAWVLDTMEEEWIRGLTMDTDEREIDYKNHKIVFVDTPGHKDFLLSAMQGCS